MGVKWIHTYYIKGYNVIEADINNNSSWIIKNVMKQRECIGFVQQVWGKMLQMPKFSMKEMYTYLIYDNTRVHWKSLFMCNRSRPRALLTLWLVCHGKLATKDRMCRFGMLDDNICCLCLQEEESINHFFFGYKEINSIWGEIIKWLEVVHKPKEWNEELPVDNSKYQRKMVESCYDKAGYC